MLEGKSEKLGFQEMLSSPHWKIEVSKRKTKRIEESKKKIWKREMNKKTMKKMIFGQITLKYSLGLLFFSFETMNPGLYYVPEKSILIKRGYLDWRAFSSRNFFL